MTKDIIYILVGVCILLCGMKLMSQGLKKSIGGGIRRFFKKTQNNPLISMGIGTTVTAGIQSSDATNAMVIGFINAGAMSIYQGLCIMLGAYIGTTVTGVLASFSSLSISVYFLLFSVIGTIMMFFKKDKVKNIGEILCGLGFLFFGIALMKDSFKNPEITAGLQNVFSYIKFGPLLFLLGVLITAILQSSSAMTSIVIAMVGSSALGLSSGLYIVLGATLGTVTNTLLASIGGNADAKRAAWIAFFLRLITSVIMMIILVIFESQLASFFHIFAINGSDELPIAMFTVLYNIVFMPLLLPFIKPSIKLFTKIIKDKKVDALSKSIHFIDDRLLNSPNVAAMQVKKEIIGMYDLAFENYISSMDMLLKNEVKEANKIAKKEEQIDFLNSKITDFLINLSNKVSSKEEKKIGSYFHVINDIERIGDHAYNFSDLKIELDSKDLAFSNTALNDVDKINKQINEMFILTKTIFENNDTSSLNALHELGNKIQNLKKEVSTQHFNRIKENECHNELTPYYSSLLAELGRISDHLINIAYSIDNPLGNDEDD